MAERSFPFTRRGGNGRNGSASGNGYGGGDRITGSTSFATPSPSIEPVRNRLPTLFEVLSRRTLAPVDLFSFYIYMRDQQRSVDYLDFWLDVSQHMQLCRHYVRELRRSVLIETPELEKAGSKRSSAVLDAFNTHNNDFPVGSAIAGSSTFYVPEKQTPDQRLSAFLRSEASSRRSPQGSQGSGDSARNFPLPSAPRPAYTTNGAGGGRLTPDRDRPSPSSTNRIDRSPAHNNNNNNLYTGSPMNNHHGTTVVTRSDLRASAQKILYTYLLPGAEREIILPQGILNSVTEAIEQQDRDDPEVFDSAKDYVFQAMERDAFPGFLRSKALGNLVPPSIMLRLILGLLSMFGGFWAAFVLIFMDEDRLTRLWLILPFTVGVYTLATHQYMLDPLLALAGGSEYTLFSFFKIREPYVRRLLAKRSLTVLAEVILIDAALCCLFVFVPGRRL